MTAPDLSRLYSLLRHVSYKPGWTMLPELNGENVLAIYRTVPNSLPPHESGIILSRHEIDLNVPEGHAGDAAILRQVYDAIEECEKHEAQEWFRVDGEAAFDPHRGDDKF